MKTKKITIIILFSLILSIYLFVTAPPPLITEANLSKRISIKEILQILNAENKVVRSIYTKEIVIKGKKSGLKFDEKWQEEGVDAGPLPAQFLRETAKNLERRPVRLGLYLGSDYPINEANKLTGMQLQIFTKIKKNKIDRFFHVAEMGVYVYMSADIAIAEACVNCHNNHKQSPKSDWVLNDVMGATTWTYPDEKISVEDALLMISEFQLSVRTSYERYIKQISLIKNPPSVGKKWPIEGYYLPSAKEFMKQVTSESSKNTLSSLVQLVKQLDKAKVNGI